MATFNQHPPSHLPLDAHYSSVVDEPQLSQYLISPWEPILLEIDLIYRSIGKKKDGFYIGKGCI
jgi:hypothetical protein